MNIRLYETNDVVKAVCQLTEKLYNQNKRVQIFCANPLMVVTIDNALWQCKQMSFLPHMTDLDAVDPLTQPIFITSRSDENVNQAAIVLSCNTVPKKIDCDDLIGICDATTCSEFINTYPPDQQFIQTENGAWSQKIRATP